MSILDYRKLTPMVFPMLDYRKLTPMVFPMVFKLDYTPEPETVTVTFKSDALLQLQVPGARVERVSPTESSFTVAAPREDQWTAFTLSLGTPARTLGVSYVTTRDSRSRALPTRRFLMPFATPARQEAQTRDIPEISGGNWKAGRELFVGKAACASCHQLRGDGVKVGTELTNLIHRDYASVLKDLIDPTASINPDAAGYIVKLKDGESVTGTRLAEAAEEIQIAQAGGAVVKLKRNDIASIEPMKISLMPSGLEKTLSKEELRDLMTYLLTEPK